MNGRRETVKQIAAEGRGRSRKCLVLKRLFPLGLRATPTAFCESCKPLIPQGSGNGGWSYRCDAKSCRRPGSPPGGSYLKPKPFSVQQRIILLQAVAIGVALWFIGATLYVGLQIRAHVADATDAARGASPQGNQELARLEDATAQLNEEARVLLLLLVAADLYAVLLIRTARKMHREHLWEPLGRLQEMVRQVRRGNLNVSAPVHRSLEVGPLVE